MPPRQLNFTPNRTARTLRRQNSEVIALVIPDIENPYFTEMARGVEDVAQEAGYSVVLCNTDDARSSKEATYLRDRDLRATWRASSSPPPSDHSEPRRAHRAAAARSSRSTAARATTSTAS